MKIAVQTWAMVDCYILREEGLYRVKFFFCAQDLLAVCAELLADSGYDRVWHPMERSRILLSQAKVLREFSQIFETVLRHLV